MTTSQSVVLDASALLAYLYREPGGDLVSPFLGTALICSVNWAEVTQDVLARGGSLAVTRGTLLGTGLEIIPFATEDAEATAGLLLLTKHLGLSLGDRACIALAQRLDVPALTADRSWRHLALGIEVRLIR